MLRKAGLPGAGTASGLTAVNLLTFGTLFALPLLALPAVLLGPPIPEDLLQGLWVALGALAILFAVGAVLLVADRPLRRVGAAIQAVRNSVLRKRAPVDGLPERLVRERDLILGVLGHSRWEALAGSIGRWLLDYGALLVAVRAVGSDSRALLVLLAFVTAQVLAQIPVTPGGLGFVEAGLTAMLVLAGVGAADAALATLAYRLASYWLPLPAGAAAWGIHAWRYREPPAPQGGSNSAAAADRLERLEQDPHPATTDEHRTGEHIRCALLRSVASTVLPHQPFQRRGITPAANSGSPTRASAPRRAIPRPALRATRAPHRYLALRGTA